MYVAAIFFTTVECNKEKLSLNIVTLGVWMRVTVLGEAGREKRVETRGPRGSEHVPACFGSVSLPVECLSCPRRLVVPL